MLPPPGFKILRTLAERDGRTVLECVESRTGRPAVLKCLSAPGGGPLAEALAGSFKQEFLLLHAIRHSCWATPSRFSASDDGTVLSFVLERARGRPLSDLLPLKWDRNTFEIGRRVLSALQTLHALGYAHLDLKPDQVLVQLELDDGDRSSAASGVGAVTVVDLGLAAELGAPIDPRGTPGYIAPELLSGRPWDKRADLYSFGCVLFEVLAGSPAFPGDDVRTILNRQRIGGPELAALGRSGAPQRLISLIADLLSPEPSDRPQDATECWGLLREAAGFDDGVLPMRLVSSDELAFVGRQRETAAFTDFLSQGSSSRGVSEGPAARIEIRGAPGTGKRRLLNRLVALAETCGWSAAAPTEHQDAATATVLQQEGVEVEIRIREDRGSALDAAEASGTAALSFHLGELDHADLLAAIRSAAIESESLSSVCARLCAGVPRLLADLLTLVPRELDVPALVGAEAQLGEAIGDLVPPASWVEFAARTLEGLPQPSQQRVLRLALASAARLIASPETSYQPKRNHVPVGDDLAAELAILVESRLWARAVLDAVPEGAVASARAYAAEPGTEGANSALTLVEAVRVFLAAGDGGSLRDRWEDAVESLVKAGRAEDAFRLYVELTESLGRELGPGRSATLTAILSLLPIRSRIAGQQLRCAAELLVSSDPSSLGSLGIRAWEALGRGAREEASSLIAAARQLAQSWEDELLVGYLFHTDWMLAREEGAGTSYIDGLLLRAPSPGELVRLGMFRVHQRSAGRDAWALAQLRDYEGASGSMPIAERVKYWELRLIHEIREARIEDARASAEAGLAYCEELGLAEQQLGFAALQIVLEREARSLGPSLESSVRLALEWLRRRRWEDAARAVLTLAVREDDAGMPGKALSRARWAMRLPGKRGVIALQTFRDCETSSLLALGAVARVHDLLRPFDDDSVDESDAGIVARRRLGACHYEGGDLVTARARFRAAVRSAGARSADLVRVTAEFWLTRELTLLPAPDSLPDDLPIEALQHPDSFGYLASRLCLGELMLSAVLAGELAFAADARTRLESALQEAEESGARGEAWRASWRLGRLALQLGDPHAARFHYERARIRLIERIEDAASVGLDSPFLRLRAIQAFLDDLRVVGGEDLGQVAQR